MLKQLANDTSTPSSQITTDVLVAGVKVISKEASALGINVHSLSPLDGDQMEGVLGEDGAFVIRNGDNETKISFDAKGDASIAGTLRADKIIANEIEGLEKNVTQVVTEQTAASALSYQKLENNQKNLETAMASISASLEKLGNLNLSSFAAGTPDGDDLVMVNNFASYGTTTLSEVSILKTLTIGTGQTLVLGSNSLDALGSDLSLQGLKQGGVSFLGGAIRFESDGTALFSENAAFKKNVTVTGVLSARTVSTEDLKLSKGAVTVLSDTEVESTSSAGLVVLKKGEDFVRVLSPYIKESSLIFITSKTKTTRRLFLLEQSEATDGYGSFTVEADGKAEEDIKFNYLIVD